MPGSASVAVRIRTYVVLLIHISLLGYQGHCQGMNLRPRSVTFGKDAMSLRHRTDTLDKQGLSLILGSRAFEKEGAASRHEDEISGKQDEVRDRVKSRRADTEYPSYWPANQVDKSRPTSLKQKNLNTLLQGVDDEDSSNQVMSSKLDEVPRRIAMLSKNNKLRPVGMIELNDDTFRDPVGSASESEDGWSPKSAAWRSQEGLARSEGEAKGPDDGVSLKRWTDQRSGFKSPIRRPRDLRARSDENPLELLTEGYIDSQADNTEDSRFQKSGENGKGERELRHIMSLEREIRAHLLELYSRRNSLLKKRHDPQNCLFNVVACF